MKKMIILIFVACFLFQCSAETACPNCGYMGNNNDASFCGKCGKSLSQIIVCKYCEFANSPDNTFCNSCGRRLTSNVVEAKYLCDIDTLSTKGKYRTSHYCENMWYRWQDKEINKDMKGNIYEHVIFPFYSIMDFNPFEVHSNSETYATYYLDNKYTKLTGVLFLPYRNRGVDKPDIASKFKVYGDDVLLYEAPQFKTGSFNPVEIDVDITGITVLKVEIDGLNREVYLGDESYYPMVCAADLKVQ